MSYVDTQKKVPPKVLSAPITTPLQVRIRWMLWKYSVIGTDIHFVQSGFELKAPSTKEHWYRQIFGSECEAVLEQADNGMSFYRTRSY